MACIGFFPLKESAGSVEVLNSMTNLETMPWLLPVDDLKCYLGEKIGFYFAFLGHYTTFLLPLALVGLITFLEVAFSGSLATGGFLTPVFALVVCVWAQAMIEYWKRKQALKAMEWGMSNYMVEERELAAFAGEEMPSG